MTKDVAIVTGGGSGIGAAVVRRLTSDGWQVAAVGRRTDRLEEIARETGCLAIAGDVATPGVGATIVARTLEHFGRIDGLVCNAGIFEYAAVEALDADTWRRTLDVNLEAVLWLVQAALPALREARGGVVAISSLGAQRATAGYAAYVSSKAALTALIRTVAVEEASSGIRANVVLPGWTRTEMADAGMRQLADRFGGIEGAYDHATRHVPLKRPGRPEELAAVVAFLLSRESSYITATSIPVDGGLHAIDASQDFG